MHRVLQFARTDATVDTRLPVDDWTPMYPYSKLSMDLIGRAEAAGVVGLIFHCTVWVCSTTASRFDLRIRKGRLAPTV